MQVTVTVDDVLGQTADTLICPANPWLNMSGGVNGEILLRCGDEIQNELRSHLESHGSPTLAPESIVTTNASNLNFQKIIHVIAIDAFYDTNQQLVTTALVKAWRAAADIGTSAAMPAIATGYGRLPIEDFAIAFKAAFEATSDIDLQLQLCLRQHDEQELFCDLMSDIKYYFIVCNSRFVLASEPYMSAEEIEAAFDDLISWQGPISETELLDVINSSFVNPLDNPFSIPAIKLWFLSGDSEFVVPCRD